jgi:fluoride exporter
VLFTYAVVLCAMVVGSAGVGHRDILKPLHADDSCFVRTEAGVFVRRSNRTPEQNTQTTLNGHDPRTIVWPRLIDRIRGKTQTTEHRGQRDWMLRHMIYAWLAVGGALGTMSRYAVSGWVVHRYGPSPLGTFTVNIVGAFLIGLILVIAQDRFLIRSDIRVFLTTGFLGGFTTFSTFMFETMELVEAGSLERAVLNAGGSLAAGLVAVWLGMTVARLV